MKTHPVAPTASKEEQELIAWINHLLSLPPGSKARAHAIGDGIAALALLKKKH